MESRIDRKPRFASHFPSLHGRGIEGMSYMFAEDVHLGVMPIGGQSTYRSEFDVQLEGEADCSEPVSKLLEGVCNYHRYDLKELICDAVNSIAQDLAWNGAACYEMIEDESSRIVLHPFTSERLFRFPGVAIQLVPQKDWAVLGKKVIAVPTKELWYVKMPQLLGGSSGYKKILSRLRKHGEVGPKFWLKDLDSMRAVNSFSLEEYTKESEIFIRQTTAVWGWNHRDVSTKNTTEYYIVFRQLTFEWARAILREYILEQLNQLLTRLKIDCQVLVTGLPSSFDMLRCQQELERGNITFKEALDQTML